MSVDPQIDERIRSSFARMQTMATFGASLHAVRKGEVEIVLPFSAALVQRHGFIHAGVLATITDTACGYAALTLMPSDAAVLTTEFRSTCSLPLRASVSRRSGGLCGRAAN